MFSEQLLREANPLDRCAKARSARPVAGKAHSVYLLQSSQKSQCSYEDFNGGIFTNAFFNECATMDPRLTVDDFFNKVSTAVRSHVELKDLSQIPKISYYGDACGSRKMKEIICYTQKVVLIAPGYSGDRMLPGVKASVEKFLCVIAPSFFWTNCKYDVLAANVCTIPDTDMVRTTRFKERVAFFECTQESTRIKLEEVRRSHENVMIMVFSHGQKTEDGQDEYIYFEDGNRAGRITGRYLAQLTRDFPGEQLVLFSDHCLSAGCPDEEDFSGSVVARGGRRALPPPSTISEPWGLESENAPVMSRLGNFCDFVASQVHPDAYQGKTKATIEFESSVLGIRSEVGFSVDGDTRSLSFSQQPLELPSAPVQIEAAPKPVNDTPIEAAPEPVDDTPGDKLNPRGVQDIAYTMLGRLIALLNSCAASWSVGSAVATGLPAFFGVAGSTLMLAPLYAAMLFFALSAITGIGFYLYFIRKRYAQLLSGVILTTALTAFLQFMHYDELLPEWLASDTTSGAALRSFFVSCLTILLTVAMNRREIKGAEIVILCFKNVVENSAHLTRLLAVMVHVYFSGEGRFLRQTMMLAQNGVTYYAAYKPLVLSNGTHPPTCIFELPGNMDLHLAQKSRYTLFNETYGVSCDYEMYRMLIQKFSQGKSETFQMWELYGVLYDLRPLYDSREGLIKKLGFDLTGVDLTGLRIAFLSRPCEDVGACFVAPQLQPTWSFEQGLETLAEPFFSVVDRISAVLQTSIRVAANYLLDLAYPGSRR